MRETRNHLSISSSPLHFLSPPRARECDGPARARTKSRRLTRGMTFLGLSPTPVSFCTSDSGGAHDGKPYQGVWWVSGLVSFSRRRCGAARCEVRGGQVSASAAADARGWGTGMLRGRVCSYATLTGRVTSGSARHLPFARAGLVCVPQSGESRQVTKSSVSITIGYPTVTGASRDEVSTKLESFPLAEKENIFYIADIA